MTQRHIINALKRTATDPIAPLHEWLEIGSRRWCLQCDSHQVLRDGVWRDVMLGPWPGYARTDMSAHG